MSETCISHRGGACSWNAIQYFEDERVAQLTIQTVPLSGSCVSEIGATFFPPSQHTWIQVAGGNICLAENIFDWKDSWIAEETCFFCLPAWGPGLRQWTSFHNPILSHKQTMRVRGLGASCSPADSKNDCLLIRLKYASCFSLSLSLSFSVEMLYQQLPTRKIWA